MGIRPPESTSQGRKVASYLVSSYLDLRDVILTIEQMILEHYKVRNKSLLREGCDLSILPLAGKEGYIVQIRMPEEMSE